SYAAGGPNKGKPRPEEWNRKQRETIARLIQEGEWKAGHRNSWKGYYNSNKCRKSRSFFRSGFELIYHYYLDNNQEVEWYDYEPFAIPYIKVDGREGYYHPDFLVKLKNDDCLYLREVKADYLHDSEETQRKYLQALEYVQTQPNMLYEVLLKENIYGLKIDF